MESGAEEAESRRGAMLAAEEHGKTAHNASVNVQRVTERNTRRPCKNLPVPPLPTFLFLLFLLMPQHRAFLNGEQKKSDMQAPSALPTACTAHSMYIQPHPLYSPSPTQRA